MIHLFHVLTTVNGFLFATLGPMFAWGMMACRSMARRYWS